MVHLSLSRRQFVTIVGSLALTMVLAFILGFLLGRSGVPGMQAERAIGLGAPAQEQGTLPQVRVLEQEGQPATSEATSAAAAPPAKGEKIAQAGDREAGRAVERRLTFYRSLPQPVQEQVGITPEGAPAARDSAAAAPASGAQEAAPPQPESRPRAASQEATAGASQPMPRPGASAAVSGAERAPAAGQQTAAAGAKGSPPAAAEASPQGRPTKLPSVSKLRAAAPPAASGAVAPARPAALEEGYTITVGSFREAANALKLTSELQGKGYQASILPVTISGQGSFHRVRLGGYRSRAEAEQVAKVLREREKLPARVMSVQASQTVE